MPNLQLTLACGNYDRTAALRDGTVSPEGIDLTYLAIPAAEIFWRMLRFGEFDISEMSLANYITECCEEKPRFIAMPIFPSRLFRHGYIFISKKASIKKPEDLKGKKIGIAQYTMTACVMMRGMLQHEYGVAPSDMVWFVGGKEGIGRRGKMKKDFPDSLPNTVIPENIALSDMLAEGELDAIISPFVPESFLAKHPNVERLFTNYQQAEKDYYKKTKIFPIMHTIVVKREIYEANPWVTQSLYKAFAAAKDVCQQRYRQVKGTLPVMLPWFSPAFEEAVALMGEDYWPYGVVNGRETLEAITQYMWEQELCTRKLSVEDLFAPNTVLNAGKIVH
ncbi:PhnD/SsuA/transferrin family substrate-binding protein [Chloroflexota bacterium]